jgi:hypothetical protein
MTALAGSTLAVTKPATSSADKAIESFILILHLRSARHSLSELHFRLLPRLTRAQLQADRSSSGEVDTDQGSRIILNAPFDT